MKLRVLGFGIVKDIFGASFRDIEVGEGLSISVAGFKDALESQYPEIKRLASYAIAVNNEYAADNEIIGEKDEVAVIPPVSGG